MQWWWWLLIGLAVVLVLYPDLLSGLMPSS